PHLSGAEAPACRTGVSAVSCWGGAKTGACFGPPSSEGANGLPPAVPPEPAGGAGSKRCQRHRCGVGTRWGTRGRAWVLSGLPHQARRGGVVVPSELHAPDLSRGGVDLISLRRKFTVC